MYKALSKYSIKPYSVFFSSSIHVRTNFKKRESDLLIGYIYGMLYSIGSTIDIVKSLI